ncbi:hypothetical protein [Streptomyces sp. H27-C3]|uniref:hypothetical protein n=1 Tax=Streptomyces sp. H27-C3 TaxID=3046305 RepID=UPI0024B8F7E4|nr:hypothetical protein [Streptomyces sp. H27-C3]MDJ0465047.1 hypothetical protein [Streptomyces sp. H27-C3]
MSEWTFLRGPHTIDQIAGLPVDARLAALSLIDDLEGDPYAVTAPFGEDDGLTRAASFGEWGTMVILCNPITKRITLLSVVWTS